MSEQQTRRDSSRSLMQALEAAGLTEYGSVIESSFVHYVLGISMPEMAPKSEYDRLAMIELAAIDYCRNVLIANGKYLQGTPTGYRILLPSENKGQVDAYISSADRKLSRALKLSRNTPVESNASVQDQTEARIIMKQYSYRRGSARASA